MASAFSASTKKDTNMSEQFGEGLLGNMIKSLKKSQRKKKFKGKTGSRKKEKIFEKPKPVAVSFGSTF